MSKGAAKRSPRSANLRRWAKRISLFFCCAFLLAVLTCVCAVTMVAMVATKILSSFNFEFPVLAWLIVALWLVAPLMELFMLLSTGQIGPFVMRLLSLLGSP